MTEQEEKEERERESCEVSCQSTRGGAFTRDIRQQTADRLGALNFSHPLCLSLSLSSLIALTIEVSGSTKTLLICPDSASCVSTLSLSPLSRRIPLSR